MVRQLSQRNFEVSLRAVGALNLKEFGTRNRRPQQQTFRHRLISKPFGVPRLASHACKDGVINAVVVSPTANRRISLVALVEPVLRLHEKRIKVERFLSGQLSHHEILIRQQVIQRAQNQILRERCRINALSQVHAELLDRRLRVLVDDTSIQSVLSDFEVRLDQQR